MALNDKHLKFVDEYMIDMNATAAYLRAGYKCKEDVARVNASRLLTNANVVAEIATRQVKMQEESGMNVKWVLEKYKKIIDDNIMIDPQVAKGALDSVGKHYGMFKDKGDSPITTNNVNLNGLSLEELRQLAKSKPSST